MVIATWNVCGLMNSKESFLDLMHSRQPDLMAVQETKTHNENVESFRPDGYNVIASESLRRGSCVYYKREPIDMSRHSDDIIQTEGRFQVMEYDNFYFVQIYLPHTGCNLEHKTKKQTAFNWLTAVVKKLDSMKPVIIAGDLNVATWYKKAPVGVNLSKRNQAGHTKMEKAGMVNLLSIGLTDVVTHHFPEETTLVNYLDNKSGDSKISNSFRLDYILISNRIADRVENVEILTEYETQRSKHIPIELKINL